MDRTPVQLTVYDCPPGQVRAVLDVIAGHGLRLVDGETDRPAYDRLSLGLMYLDVEALCRSAQAISTELQQDAPGAAWEVWEDPACTWPGKLCRFAPAMGLWSAQCNADGRPLFTDEQVVGLTGLGFSRGVLDTCLGRSHDAYLRELAEQNAAVVLTPTGAGR